MQVINEMFQYQFMQNALWALLIIAPLFRNNWNYGGK